jgi:3-oxoacid CoA-transferase subunit B
VHQIFTDLAVLDVTDEGLVLTEHAPGVTVDEIRKHTEPPIEVAADLRETSL